MKKNCPKKEASVRVFLDETCNEEKFRLLDHIFSCPECLSEFENLREVWRKGNDILSELDKEFFMDEKASLLTKIAAVEIKKLKSQKRIKKHFLLPPKKIFAAALGIMLIVSLFILIKLKNPGPITIQRQADRRNFSVIAPWGEIHQPKILFQWTPLQNVKKYDLEILDDGLDIFYQTEDILTNSFILPEEIRIRLSEEKTYFWKIVATLKNSQKIESEMGKFIIKKD